MIEVDTKESEEKDGSEDKDTRKSREALETWLAEQDEKVQTMVQDGIAGLTSALQKEREAAKEASRLEKELEEARSKLDEYKTDEEKELDDLSAKVEQLSTEKAEAEKLAAEATSKLVEKTISFAVTAEALKMGFEDPSDAESLLPKDAVTYNEETGEVEGAEKALKELSKAKPYLLGSEGHGTPRSSSRKKKMSSEDKKAPVTGVRF